MQIWEIFPDVADRVRWAHEECGLVGHHDWVHAFRVGEVAQRVALVEWADERRSYSAGLAGLCHNADRIIQNRLDIGQQKPPRVAVVACVSAWLLGQDIDKASVEAVVSAVLKHDGKNSPDDSPVLIALMDADRVVNLDVDLFPRSGQYYHDLPVVDYRHFLSDPEATYCDPKSVLRDIAYSLDWADPSSPVCVRTRLGRKMAQERVQVFRTFFDALRMQLQEEGIHPYPFAS